MAATKNLKTTKETKKAVKPEKVVESSPTRISRRSTPAKSLKKPSPSPSPAPSKRKGEKFKYFIN